MKKYTSLFVALALVFSLFSGCSETTQPNSDARQTNNGSTQTDPSNIGNLDDVVLEKHKIGVANFSTDSYALLIQQYLTDYIAPAFNVEFMFSEGAESTEAMMDFLENAYAAGCEGIINYSSESVDQVTSRCNDLGMYIITHTTTPGTVNDLPYNLGYIGADTATSAKDFSVLVHDLVGDGEKHSVVILSGGAGMGKANDFATTVASLESLADIYNLSFEEDIETLAGTRAEKVCANDGGVKITIYPGYANTDTYVPGLSSLLQGGEYDIILCNSTAFTQVATAIDEVERAFNVNIKICAKAQVSEVIETSFETLDSFGDSFLSSAMLTPSISTAASMFIIMYNGISGHADVVRRNNEAIDYDSPKWCVFGPEDYEMIKILNTSDETWEIGADNIKEMLAIYNPDITVDDIFTFVQNTGDLDFILDLRDLR